MDNSDRNTEVTVSTAVTAPTAPVTVTVLPLGLLSPHPPRKAVVQALSLLIPGSQTSPSPGKSPEGSSRPAEHPASN